MMFLEQVLPMTQPVWPLPAQSWSWEKLLQAVRAGLMLLQKGFYRIKMKFHQQLVHYRYQHWGQRPVLLLQSVLRQRHEGPALQAQEQVPGSSDQDWLQKLCWRSK